MEREQLLNILSQRVKPLAPQLADDKFREEFLITNMRASLSDQIRALRGDKSQAEYSAFIHKPQSVVSRLEDPDSAKSIQSLLDIAHAHKIALLVRFVSYEKYFEVTSDHSDEAMAPAAYNKERFSELANKKDYGYIQVLPKDGSSTITICMAEHPNHKVFDISNSNHPSQYIVGGIDESRRASN